MTIRVATWNLWWKKGPWRERYEVIAEELAASRADICGLQEVWADGTQNRGQVLAEQLGMYWTWIPTPLPEQWNVRISDPSVIVGNAILSRWPIVHDEYIHLNDFGAEPSGRTAACAIIQAPVGAISFFTTHLNSGFGQSRVRCGQVRQLAQFVASRRAVGDFPAIVCGDFNADPESDEVRLFEGRLTEAPCGLPMVDAWRYRSRKETGHTWNPSNSYAAQHWAPPARIDYVFVEVPPRGGLGRVSGARLFGDRETDGVWPSDHAGVVVDLAS